MTATSAESAIIANFTELLSLTEGEAKELISAAYKRWLVSMGLEDYKGQLDEKGDA